MSSSRVLILGASSDIGLAIARRFAQAGHPVSLAARRPEELEAEASDMRLRFGVEVSLHRFDVLDTEAHEAFLGNLPDLPETAICVVGLLGEQKLCEQDAGKAIEVIRTNYEGPATMLATLANRFEARGSGILIGVGSVAGDRGRASNYVYGSAKAGFAAYLSGLRNRLAGTGVHVITIKPGFVSTRMTENMTTPKLLTAAPEEVGDAAYRAWRRRQNVVYVRPIWRVIMFIIGSMPERLFKRTRL